MKRYAIDENGVFTGDTSMEGIPIENPTDDFLKSPEDYMWDGSKVTLSIPLIQWRMERELGAYSQEDGVWIFTAGSLAQKFNAEIVDMEPMSLGEFGSAVMGAGVDTQHLREVMSEPDYLRRLETALNNGSFSTAFLLVTAPPLSVTVSAEDIVDLQNVVKSKARRLVDKIADEMGMERLGTIGTLEIKEERGEGT